MLELTIPFDEFAIDRADPKGTHKKSHDDLHKKERNYSEYGNSQSMVPKPPHMDFPRFDGKFDLSIGLVDAINFSTTNTLVKRKN